MIGLCLAVTLQLPADSLTLSQALERAAANRPQARAAAARVDEARAALRTAGAVPNPTVSYSHSESVPREHLLVDQSLEWLLRRGPDRRAARFGVARAEADSSQALGDLLRSVRVGFYRARSARLAEGLVNAQAVLADSVAAIAAARFRAGDISQLEQEQAAQEAARARRTVSTAREAAALAESELARVLAWEGPVPQPAGALDEGLDAMPDTALDLSAVATVRSAVADSAAAAAAARSASVTRVPLPTLQSGAEWSDESQPGTLAVIGVSIPLPLWQRGGGPVAEARARARESAALTAEARLDARRSVQQAQARLREAAVRARLGRDTLLPGADSLRARALHAYQAGETGILPLLEALRAEREVSLGVLDDEVAYQEAVADWLALAGRSR
jgi:cobalt-zinc-cadmium efflux system outer membrane protein